MTLRFELAIPPHNDSGHLHGGIHHLRWKVSRQRGPECVGEPSKIAVAEKNVSWPSLGRPFFSLNDAFYAGVKTFFAKTRWLRQRETEDGEGNDVRNDLQSTPVRSFFLRVKLWLVMW